MLSCVTNAATAKNGAPESSKLSTGLNKRIDCLANQSRYQESSRKPNKPAIVLSVGHPEKSAVGKPEGNAGLPIGQAEVLGSTPVHMEFQHEVGGGVVELNKPSRAKVEDTYAASQYVLIGLRRMIGIAQYYMLGKDAHYDGGLQ